MTTKLILWAILPVLAATSLPLFGCTQQQGQQKTPDEEHQIGGPVTTVGDPKDPDSLPGEIAEAYASGSHRIVIRGGNYVLSKKGKPIILLENWRNARISGHGVTLTSSETEWNCDLFKMRNCTNVHLEDLTLSQTWQTATQGKIVSVNQEDPQHTSCVWRPDAGYPAPEATSGHMDKGPNVVDGHTRQLKLGIPDQWDATMSPQGDGAYQIRFKRPVNLVAGDFLVARNGAAPCKVQLIGCRECQLSNLTLIRNSFAPIREDQGGGNSYFDCHWILGPKPEGATEKPLVSCSSDGFHSTEAYPGPDLENCEFAGVMLDDCIAIHGYLQKVTESHGDTLTVDEKGGKLKEGQPIRIAGPGFFENAFVSSIARSGDTATVTLDRSLDVPPGSRVSNPLWNGQSFKILNCQIGHTRSRGILVKADGGLISGNLISGCGMSGVSAGPEYNWKEGDYVQELTVQGNRFVGNGFAGADPAVLIHGEGAMGNRNITIEGNTFESSYTGDVWIKWASGVTIQQNSFSSPSTVPAGMRRVNPLFIIDSEKVRVLKNQVKDWANYKHPLALVDAGVRDVTQDGSN